MVSPVQQTDYDALSCKIAAISKRYLPPPNLQGLYRDYVSTYSEFWQNLKPLLSRRDRGKITKSISSSFPVMNYGTYLRTISIDTQLDEICQSASSNGESLQIVNLGCGTDLRCVSLLQQYDSTIVKYLDLDFNDSMELKSDAMWNSNSIKNKLNIIKDDTTNNKFVHSDIYHIIGTDLSDIMKTLNILKQNLDLNIRTIFITECVLCYLTTEDSQLLIDSILKIFKLGNWISYDPIGGIESQSRFGTIMQSNLRESRQLDMPTLLIYNTKEKYAKRWNQSNTNINVNITINLLWDIYQNNISNDEKLRLKNLQFLDEIEELKIMQSHYILAIINWSL